MASYPTQAPSRATFRRKQVRYMDSAGRTYVLPEQNDPILQRFVQSGDVDRDNYERKLRKGLAFDPTKEMHELTSRVMMYVQLPTPAQSVKVRRERELRSPDEIVRELVQEVDKMPPVSGSAGDTALKPLILRNELTGVLYEASVERVQAKRRDKRGMVILTRVRRINKQ
jgi:hypothetical protein